MEYTGIILAGGAGTRLYPLTLVTSKQLLPVYDKPMIYYPLSVLMLAGIRDTSDHLHSAGSAALPAVARRRASSGASSFHYAEQPQPERDRGGDPASPGSGSARDRFALVLGDNIFYGHGLTDAARAAAERAGGASVFAYHVNDPERYGVVEFDAHGRALGIEEKPREPRSNYAVTGLYFYDERAFEFAQSAASRRRAASWRSPISIRTICDAASCTCEIMGRGYAWLDTGTHESLIAAATFIEAIETRQALKVACPEEIAYPPGLHLRGSGA